MSIGRVQPTAKKRKRGPGRPFRKDDPRINRQGKSKQLSELEREFRQAIVDELYRPDECDPESRRTNFQALARRWVELGKDGNLAAIEGLVERVLGKAVQPLSGDPEGNPIRVIVDVPSSGLHGTGQ